MCARTTHKHQKRHYDDAPEQPHSAPETDSQNVAFFNKKEM
jgi:hypothetical protein